MYTYFERSGNKLNGPTSLPMKRLKTAPIWKAANVTFNEQTLEAHSYAWWLFVAKIKEKLVFNNYRYSVTTARHQSKVKEVLKSLGIKIDIEIEAPKGLDKLDIAIEHYEMRIKKLNAEMIKPRKRKATIKKLADEANSLTKTLMKIKKLL